MVASGTFRLARVSDETFLNSAHAWLECTGAGTITRATLPSSISAGHIFLISTGGLSWSEFTLK